MVLQLVTESSLPANLSKGEGFDQFDRDRAPFDSSSGRLVSRHWPRTSRASEFRIRRASRRSTLSAQASDAAAGELIESSSLRISAISQSAAPTIESHTSGSVDAGLAR